MNISVKPPKLSITFLRWNGKRLPDDMKTDALYGLYVRDFYFNNKPSAAPYGNATIKCITSDAKCIKINIKNGNAEALKSLRDDLKKPKFINITSKQKIEFSTKQELEDLFIESSNAWELTVDSLTDPCQGWDDDTGKEIFVKTSHLYDLADEPMPHPESLLVGYECETKNYFIIDTWDLSKDITDKTDQQLLTISQDEIMEIFDELDKTTDRKRIINKNSIITEFRHNEKKIRGRTLGDKNSNFITSCAFECPYNCLNTETSVAIGLFNSENIESDKKPNADTLPQMCPHKDVICRQQFFKIYN